MSPSSSCCASGTRARALSEATTHSNESTHAPASTTLRSRGVPVDASVGGSVHTTRRSRVGAEARAPSFCTLASTRAVQVVEFVPYEQVDPTDGFEEVDGYTTTAAAAASGWATDGDDDEEAPF